MIAGSLDYAGAALLVCRAAGRAGAGLVTLAVPESLQPLFAAKVVEATTMALPEDDVEEVDPEPALAKVLDHEHDALVIGPGLRPSLAIADLLRLLLTAPEENAGSPVVLDAEALRTLASADELVGERHAAVRPDAARRGVRAAARGQRPRSRRGRRPQRRRRRARAGGVAAAAEWHQVVVLKGANTVIAAPDGSASIAPFENPAMASGGTGDVLAGTIGALLAQGLAPYDAARLGVYLHGQAGELVRERIGDAGLLASDLPEAVPMVRKRLAAHGRAPAARPQARVRRHGTGSRHGTATPRTDRRRRTPARPDGAEPAEGVRRRLSGTIP